MPVKRNICQNSYKRHEEHYTNYIQGGEKEKHAKSWLDVDTVDAWLHARLFKSIDPLFITYTDATWLTIGDGQFGREAHYIREKGLKVLATDISDLLLKEGKAMGYIDDYRKENAESLSFLDNSFDFVLCKGSFHHFPRPMIGLYEMLRVAKKGVVLIEPNDPYIGLSFFEVLIRDLKDFAKYIVMLQTELEFSSNYVSCQHEEESSWPRNENTIHLTRKYRS